MASDRGQNRYSDFVALETLLCFENCSSSNCLLSSWRRFLPSPCTAFSQSFSVNSFRWRIRGERAGNAFTFSHGPRDPKRFAREEKWGLGTRQASVPCLRVAVSLVSPYCVLQGVAIGLCLLVCESLGHFLVFVSSGVGSSFRRLRYITTTISSICMTITKYYSIAKATRNYSLIPCKLNI